MRANEFIAEIFQPGKTNWKWIRRNSEEADAQFIVGDREYRWNAFTSRRGSKTWTIQFRLVRNALDPDSLDLFGTTGTGNSAEVMSTAVDIMRSFLQEYGLDKVEEITFSAKEDSRIGLYAKMIKRLLPGWDLFTTQYTGKDADDGMEFHLTDRRAYDKPENKLSETINPDILHPKFKHQQKIGKFIYTAQSFDKLDIWGKPEKGLMISCFQKDIVKPAFMVAYAEFVIHSNKINQWLESADTEVFNDFRGENIASTMYAYAKMLGNDVKPSTVQLKPGKDMWKAWKKSGAAQHLVK